MLGDVGRFAADGGQDDDIAVLGVRVGDGMYGEENEKATFTIGDAHVSIADDTTKTVSVFDNGKLVRAMPTSMG